MRVSLIAGGAAVLAAAIPVAGGAQALSCVVPAGRLNVRPDLANARQPKRLLPTGGYTLALSWSPQHCRERGRQTAARFQCGGGNRFGFVLHGLWPDGRGKDWPQYCRPAALLPQAVLRANLCATPSAQLIQHEWAKHGTCMSGETPTSYFGRATRLYRQVRYPDMDALSRRRLTVAALSRAIAGANPGLRADMMRITTTRGGWLDEVWLCLDTRFRHRRCPTYKGGAPGGAVVKVWRGRR